MAIGNQPTQAFLNQQAGQLVLNARSALQQIMYFNSSLNSLGQQGLIDLGFAPADAAQMLTVFGDLAAVANMCQGQPYAGPALPFNFLEETIPLWGGQ